MSKDINDVFPEHNITNNEPGSTTVDHKVIIPATAHDLGNYLAKYGMANFQIQFIMKIDGTLDFDTLVKAVRLLVEAEPVFGCRFVKSDSPYWKRFDDIDDTNKFCSFEETDDDEESVNRFLESPMSMDKDPMVLIRLIRKGAYDTLGIKINHVCCDGAGARDYVLLLSEIYSHIAVGDTAYRPDISIRDRKDIDELKIAFSDDSPDTAWSIPQQMALPTWTFPWKNIQRGKVLFPACRIPEGQLDIMSKYAKERNATINDLLLTAIFRAMFKLANTPYGIPMDIPITIDLRKYLPDHKADAIRNLSGGIVIKLDRRHQETFEDTLARVTAATAEIRSKHPSILNSLWAEYIESMDFRYVCAYFKYLSQLIEFASFNPFFTVYNCGLTLSNCGYISKSLIHLGNRTVTDAYIIPPAIRAPGILLVASTYNGIITLATGYYKPSAHKSDVETLLKKIVKELQEGCHE